MSSVSLPCGILVVLHPKFTREDPPVQSFIPHSLYQKTYMQLNSRYIYPEQRNILLKETSSKDPPCRSSILLPGQRHSLAIFDGFVYSSGLLVRTILALCSFLRVLCLYTKYSTVENLGFNFRFRAFITLIVKKKTQNPAIK